MKYSFVIPVFNEEENVEQLVEEIREAMVSVSDDYEIVFVDDRSTDGTFNLLKNLDVTTVPTFIGKGKSAALKTGFNIADGSIIFTLDGDLQDDPKDIPKFLKELKHCDFVVGNRTVRNASFEKRFFSKVFNVLVWLLTGVPVRDSNCGFKCFKRNVLEGMKFREGFHRFLPSLVYYNGFKVCEVMTNNRKRKSGNSKFGFGRLLIGFVDLLFVAMRGSDK